jgi:SAM-dependent methyltransferase
MAIDYNCVRFLLWAKNLGASFERTIMLGHLGFVCPPRLLRRALRDFNVSATREAIELCYQREPCKDVFAEAFLRLLGAREIVSVDRSDFEGATFLHDLNEPFPERMRERFDLVLDGGTLEHIFDFPAALRHCLSLLASGGHFVTTAPANQFLGHGFYQFSPEVYFRVFCPENGFRLRKIILYEALETEAEFYEVTDPAVLGTRAEINSSPPVLLAVLAQRTAQVPIFGRLPQQSDYASAWGENPAKSGPSAPGPAGKLRQALNPYWPWWLRALKGKLVTGIRSSSNTMSSSRALRRLTVEQVVNERASRS